MPGGNSAPQTTGTPVIDQAIATAVETNGSGAPTALAGVVGARYWRSDTPGTANQRLYICTVAGIAGAATWVGIL